MDTHVQIGVRLKVPTDGFEDDPMLRGKLHDLVARYADEAREIGFDVSTQLVTRETTGAWEYEGAEAAMARGAIQR